MTTSNTYNFDPANSDLILDAFERIGKRSNQLDSNMLRSAARSAGFVLSGWSNLGVNLFEVSTATVALVDGTATYILNSNVVQVLSLYITVSSVDTMLYPIGRDDYAAIPNKTSEAKPTSFWFNRQSTPRLTFWQTPDQAYTVTAYVMTRIQDFAASMAQTADVPYRFLDAFVADLAAALAVKYAPERWQMLNAIAEKKLRDARAEDRELAPITIAPDLSGYFRP